MKLITLVLLLTMIVLCEAATKAAAPKVEWVRQVGASDFDESFSVAVDDKGNAYISGYTGSKLGDAFAGYRDAFLTKFDRNGDELWTRQIGTSGGEYSYSVAVDAVGNAYITGFTEGNLGGANVGSFDVHLTKFDSSGSLLWTEQIGTSGYDDSRSVAIDADGNAYISGFTVGSLAGATAGRADAFVAKFDSNGSQQWIQQIGTSSDDISFSVAVDFAGNAYISGYTYGSLGNANLGGQDAFLAKFDSSGNQLWMRQIGTSGPDESHSVAVDAVGDVYISGFTHGSLEGASAGGRDAFLAKFDSNGSQLWIEQFGAGGWDNGYSVVVDGMSNAFVSGYIEAVDASTWNAFLAKFDSSGSEIWTEQIGTTHYEWSYSAALDAAGNAYMSGFAGGSLGGANAGYTDAFLVKYRIVPEPGAAVLAVLAGVSLLCHQQRRRA